MHTSCRRTSRQWRQRRYTCNLVASPRQWRRRRCTRHAVAPLVSGGKDVTPDTSSLPPLGGSGYERSEKPIGAFIVTLSLCYYITALRQSPLRPRFARTPPPKGGGEGIAHVMPSLPLGSGGDVVARVMPSLPSSVAAKALHASCRRSPRQWRQRRCTYHADAPLVSGGDVVSFVTSSLPPLGGSGTKCR